MQSIEFQTEVCFVSTYIAYVTTATASKTSFGALGGLMAYVAKYRVYVISIQPHRKPVLVVLVNL